jgi:hypothetical protein
MEKALFLSTAKLLINRMPIEFFHKEVITIFDKHGISGLTEVINYLRDLEKAKKGRGKLQLEYLVIKYGLDPATKIKICQCLNNMDMPFTVNIK